MKAEGIKAIGNVITNTIKTVTNSKAVTRESVKGGEKLMAAGQDAAAVQGRAMVKPFVKPEMEVKMEKQNLKAASGGGYDHGGDVDPTPDRGGSHRAWGHDLWEEWD
ncbi:MAG: hypothetical protein NC200_03385 [Candidatus Gastranaerophilales bacterium]|nr:hypothetical protein [Candidatus Gastranaerophilales bacterium]